MAERNHPAQPRKPRARAPPDARHTGELARPIWGYESVRHEVDRQENPEHQHPHIAHHPHQPIFLTWRLHGSLPGNRSFPSATTSGQAFLTMDRILDNACTGPLYLRRPEVAT